MAEQLEIKISLDKDQARKAAEKFSADNKKINNAILTDEEAKEQASLELIRKANREKIKAQTEWMDVQAQAARDVAEQQKKDETDRAAEAKRVAAEAKRVAEAKKRAAKEAADAEKALAKESAERQKQLAREVAAERAKQSKSAALAEREEKKRLEEESKRRLEEEKNATKSAMLESAAYTKIFEMALQGVISTLKAVGDAATKAGQKSKALAEGFGDTRDQYRELSQLMGKKMDNGFALDMAKLNEKMMTTQQEGKEYLTQFYNAGAQFVGDTLSKEDSETFRDFAGAYAVGNGMAPDQAGDLAGSVLGFKNYKDLDKTKGKGAGLAQIKGDFNAVNKMLQAGKGESPVLQRQMSMVSSALLNEDEMKGSFTDPKEVATAISTAAEFSPAGAAEQIRAAVRGLRDFKGKPKSLLKEAGVDAKTGFTDAIKQLAPIVIGKAKSKGVDVQDVLRDYFEDEVTRQSIGVQINKGVESGIYGKREAIGRAEGGGAAADATVDAFMQTEVAQRRKANARNARIDAERGARNSKLDILRRQAAGNLAERGEIDTTGKNFNDWLNQKASFGVVGDAETKRIDDEVQNIIKKRAGDNKVLIGAVGDIFRFTPEAREEQLRRQMEDMEKAGVDPLKSTGPGESKAIGDRKAARAGFFQEPLAEIFQEPLAEIGDTLAQSLMFGVGFGAKGDKRANEMLPGEIRNPVPPGAAAPAPAPPVVPNPAPAPAPADNKPVVDALNKIKDRLPAQKPAPAPLVAPKAAQRR